MTLIAVATLGAGIGLNSAIFTVVYSVILRPLPYRDAEMKPVMLQGIRWTSLGVAIGLASAFGLTRLMKSLLVGVAATDATTFVSVSLLLATVAIVACWIPARRATRVDPLLALHHD